MNTATSTAPNTLQAPSRLRVLVVVRDHGIRDSVAAALADEGYEIVTTEHGADALARAAQWQPRVILLDMRLPTTDRGASLARYRWAAGPGVAIIGLAGFPVHDTAVQAAQIGADVGLAMPFDRAELRALVRWHATHHVDGGAMEGGDEARDEGANDYPSRAAPAAGWPIGTGGTASGGPAAIVDALRVSAAQPLQHSPWMTAALLAASVGATGVHDPQFEANVEALYAAGTIRLMAGGKAGGGSFYEAMLVPAAEAAEDTEAMPIPVD